MKITIAEWIAHYSTTINTNIVKEAMAISIDWHINDDEDSRIQKLTGNKPATVAVHHYFNNMSLTMYESFTPGYTNHLTESNFVKYVNNELILALKQHCSTTKAIIDDVHSNDVHQRYPLIASSEQSDFVKDMMHEYIPRLVKIDNLPIRCLAYDMLELIIAGRDCSGRVVKNTLDDAIELIYAMARSRGFRLVFCPLIDTRNFAIATHWNSEYDLNPKHYGKGAPFKDYRN